MTERKSETPAKPDPARPDPAKPDNAKTPADAFGGAEKKKGEWTHSAMQEALREPRLGGNDDKVAREELEAEKKK